MLAAGLVADPFSLNKPRQRAPVLEIKIMGGISIWQLLIIAVIVVLLFGTKKLGSIGSDLGASIKGFKKAMSDDEPKQDKTSQDADFTAKTIADKQADTNQEQAKTEDAKRHDKEQV